MSGPETTSTVRQLLGDPRGPAAGILDEEAKREIRRATLTAVCVPGYQVPFGSREMPVARGWGSGGLQVTLGVIGPRDVLKVIDQGDDGGVNATNLRRIVSATAGCAADTDTRNATVIQTSTTRITRTRSGSWPRPGGETRSWLPCLTSRTCTRPLPCTRSTGGPSRRCAA